MQVSAVLTKDARRLHPTTAEMQVYVHMQGGGEDGQTKIWTAYNTKVV